jgi:hypothetical protein
MCEITPFEQGVAVYQSPEALIMWNKSKTFNSYRKADCKQTEAGCIGGWEIVECNTNYEITNFEEAEDYAKRLISVGGVA